jgi:hypothetical protein
VSILARLYPRSWRERYGDELAALLDDRPPSPFDVADLLFGALDAQRALHFRALPRWAIGSSAVVRMASRSP